MDPAKSGPGRESSPLPKITKREFDALKAANGDIDFQGVVDGRYVDIMVHTVGPFHVATDGVKYENVETRPTSNPENTTCYSIAICSADLQEIYGSLLIQWPDRSVAQTIHNAICAEAASGTLETLLRAGLAKAGELNVQAMVRGGRFDGLSTADI